MKNATIFLLVVAVGALGIFAYYQDASLREQHRLLQELTAKLEHVPKITSLDLQQKCTRQAGEAFSHDPSMSIMPETLFALTTGFTSHYNSELGKCFVLIHISHVEKGRMTEMESLSDAFEGTAYGGYTFSSDNAKDVFCYFIPPAGGQIRCHSPNEFTDLIKVYM